MNVTTTLEGAAVLVVDDEPANVALLERMLALAGADVRTAVDAMSALDLFRASPPDLVLVDLHMPGMDGIAFMHAVDKITPDEEFVPVVVLTADATAPARERALAAGASDFLLKPFDRTEVLLRARNLLHTRALHARTREHNVELLQELEERRREEDEMAARFAAVRAQVEDCLRTGPRMVFQLVADLTTRRAVGYEALARFDAEPMRPPDAWFADAAEVGLGVELELAAVTAATTALPALPADTFLALNVSASTAASGELAEVLAPHPGDRLILEITEHAPVADYEILVPALDRLRSGGVRVAVDDAGAGFAGLHHILRLGPDIIKLDIALTRGIDQDPVRRSLAAALVTFGREIAALIVAEGIETEAELTTLAELGVMHGQGWHLGRPVPASELH